MRNRFRGLAIATLCVVSVTLHTMPAQAADKTFIDKKQSIRSQLDITKVHFDNGRYNYRVKVDFRDMKKEAYVVQGSVRLWFNFNSTRKGPEWGYEATIAQHNSGENVSGNPDLRVKMGPMRNYKFVGDPRQFELQEGEDGEELMNCLNTGTKTAHEYFQYHRPAKNAYLELSVDKVDDCAIKARGHVGLQVRTTLTGHIDPEFNRVLYKKPTVDYLPAKGKFTKGVDSRR